MKKNKTIKMNLKIIFFLLFSFFGKLVFSCDCAAFPPLTESLFKKDNPRQLVFKGKVLKVGACDELATCTFEVQELYFGKVTKHIVAVYDCSSDCQMSFNAGEEWIIYGEYVQMEKIKIDFCSRSRKINNTNSQEIDQIAYGSTTADELVWLREKIGPKNLQEENVNRELAHQNVQPSAMQKVYLLGGSILFMVLFLILIKKFLK